MESADSIAPTCFTESKKALGMKRAIQTVNIVTEFAKHSIGLCHNDTTGLHIKTSLEELK